MKKVLLIIAALAVIAIGGVAVFKHQNKSAGPGDFATYVPQNVILVANATKLNEYIDILSKSSLGHFVSKETMNPVLEEMGLSQQQVQSYDSMIDNLNKNVHSPFFRTLFGDDYTAAFFAPDPQLLKENPIFALQQSFISFVKSGAGSLVEIFGKFAKGVQIEKEKVDEFELTRITVDQGENGKTILYAYDDKGLILISFNKDLIKTCLSTKKSDNSLAKTAAYQEAAKFWKDEATATTYFRSFYQVKQLAAFIASINDPQMGKDIAEVKKEVLAYLSGLEYAYGISGKAGAEYTDKSKIKVQYAELHALFKGMIDDSSQIGTNAAILSLINDKTLAFQWGYSLKGEDIVKKLEQESPLALQQLQEGAQQALGIPLEEAAASFGPRYGGALNGIIDTAVFPIPDLTLFTNIRNPAAAQNIIGVLSQKIDELGLPGEPQKLANGTTMYSWPAMAEVGLIPSMGMNNSLFYVGTMRNSVQPMLEKKAPETVNLPEALTKGLGPERSGRFTKANAGAFLIYPQRLATQAKGAVDMLVNAAASASAVHINLLSQELLKLMHSVELVVGTTNANKDYIEWESCLIPAKPEATAPQEAKK